MEKKIKTLIIINIILCICLLVSIFTTIHWYNVAKKNQEFHMYQFEQSYEAYKIIDNLENKISKN